MEAEEKITEEVRRRILEIKGKKEEERQSLIKRQGDDNVQSKLGAKVNQSVIPEDIQ